MTSFGLRFVKIDNYGIKKGAAFTAPQGDDSPKKREDYQWQSFDLPD